MDNHYKRHEELLNAIDETSRLLDEKFKNGEITKYMYDELKTFDVECSDERDSIDLFKELYAKRKPIKCSELLLAIYDKHKGSFRKAVLLSECFPDPLGFKYNQEVHEFTLSIIERAFKVAHQKEYPEEFAMELHQLYLAFDFFNHNNIKNTEKLNECEFMSFSLSAQIRMICLFLQDQSRLEEEQKYKSMTKKNFITGMEHSVSNRKTDTNPDVLISFEDNFEGLLDAFDILIRYLYFKKSSDYKSKTIPEHGDITHLKIPSFELIIHLSIQRNLLIKAWEKFKYSQWNIGLMENNSQEIYIFRPKLEQEYRAHIIAGNRRHYSLVLNILKNIESARDNEEISSEILSEFSKNEVEKIFEISKKDYFFATRYYQSVINSYITNMPPYYLEIALAGLNVENIFKAIEFFYVLGDFYKKVIYKDFDGDVDAWYKYLCPIFPINFFVDGLIRYYDFSKEDASKLIACFTFSPKTKGESDIFSRPLILINSEHIIFCPVLIQQMNLERIIETLISNHKVNIARIGTDFENHIKQVLSYFKGIKVNTNKIAFLASDGRDVEFDFVGTFDDHLLLWEFKAMTVPYGDKKLLECKKTIMEGVTQIRRRSQLLKTDWNKIKELANIELPEKPFSDDKIIKLVGTNIFDFTTLTFEEDIRIVDESTLLKFFVDPEVKVVDAGDAKVLSSTRMWKNSNPTVDEFKKYLENPITTSPYNKCIKAQFKPFDIFEDDYPFGIVDQILAKDPYGQEIKTALQFKKKAPTHKKKTHKKRKK